MATDSQKLNSITQAEHDRVEYRKRVQMYADGNSVSYEDTSFVTGDSPAILAINVDLKRNGHDGYIINDGVGNIKVEISNDGTIYGGIHTIKQDEVLELNGIVINKIRLTWVTDSSYRCFII